MLDEGLLDALEGEWRRQRAPILSHLNPGLSDEEIDQLTEPLGLQIPEEARRWWRWHNGATSDRWLDISAGPKPFLSLEQCVKKTIFHRNLAREMEDEDYGDSLSADEFWRDRFLLVTGSPGSVVCDCSVARNAPTPMIYVESHDMPDLVARARSFGEMISWWIDALNDGAYRWNSEGSHWDFDWERLPQERRSTVLV